jgi:HAD superfamily, subfamily IIIB (Acid phosphatase)
MMHIFPSLRRSRVFSAAAVLAVMVLAVVGFMSAGSATPNRHHEARAVSPPPASPTNANQIQNLDQVETAIKAYYGDTPTNTPDPVNGATMLHVPSPTGAYARQMHRIESTAERYLDRRSTNASQHKKAIVLDVDDTSLNTYNYEIYSNFVFDSDTNADFVNAAAFPAVFGMPRLARDAKAEGYTIFFLTGRPTSQTAGTVTNLDDVGFPGVPADQMFLKDLSDPWLSSCAPTCTTTQYKSLTRQHIEKLGYHITANFGDQFSDLRGGFAARRFKIPNPMYFLP